MRREASFVGAVLMVALPAIVAAQAPAPTSSTTPTPPSRAVEARADQEMKRMSEFLAKVPRFALEAEETFDEMPDGQPKMELTNLRRIAVERPNRAAADATGDTLNRASWYDGKSVTILDKEHNAYAVIDAPGTIDTALDKLEDDYGLVLPLADILSRDPYANLMQGVTYGRYLGIHQAAGVPCHHLVFSQATIEWQIWIDASDKPLPRKLVITYVNEPGEPKYSAVIRRWSLDPQLPAGLFTFEAPEGAQKIDAKTMKPSEDTDKPSAHPGSKGGR